jgi:hypothetical protein
MVNCALAICCEQSELPRGIYLPITKDVAQSAKVPPRPTNFPRGGCVDVHLLISLCSKLSKMSSRIVCIEMVELIFQMFVSTAFKASSMNKRTFT